MYDLFQYNCTVMKSDLCAIEFQSSATMCSRNVNHKPIQSSQVRPSGPARPVDLSAHRQQSRWTIIKTNQNRGLESGSVGPHLEQSSQTIRTKQKSGSVSPYRTVKSDHQDQPGQWIGKWICQPIQSSQVRPLGPTRTADLSAHT